jgi:PAS domain S-box-containing protein
MTMKTKSLSRPTREFEVTEGAFDAIIDALPIPLFIKKANNFRYVVWNRAAEELLNRNRGEVLGKGDHELCPPDEAVRFLTEDQAIVSSRCPLDLPAERVQTKARGLRFLHKRKVLVTNTDGSPQYVLGTFEDITEHRLAELARQQSEALFRTLFEHSPDAVVLIDPYDPQVSWPIVDCNTAACQMNGYSRAEMIGQSIDILNTTCGTEAERADYLAKLRAEGKLKLETLHRHRDGTIFPVEVSTTLLTVGGRELVLGIDRDITVRKQTEETLRRQSSYLAALHETTLSLLRGLDIDNLLKAILNAAVRLLDTSVGYIYLLGASGNEMELKVSAGLDGVATPARLLPHEGMVGAVWRTGETLAVIDYEQCPHRLPVMAAAGRYRAAIAAPITFAGEVIGVIGLAYGKHSERRFGEDEVNLVNRFAQLAAVALDNVRLLETERAARHQAETLRAATQALSSSLDLQTVLRLILTKLKEVVPYDSASVQELRQGRLEIIGGDGIANWEAIRGATFDLTSDTHPNKEVIASRQPLILTRDISSRYTEFQAGVHSHSMASINSWLGVPLLFGDEAIGMITLDKREADFYTTEHAQIALSFAAQAAIAIHNARTYTAAQEYAAENAALYRAAAHLLNPGADLIGLAEQITHAVTGEFALANCSVLLTNEAGTELRLVARSGGTHMIKRMVLPLNGPGLTVAAARAGQIVYVPDVTTDPRYLPEESLTRSELVIPLKNQQRVIGVLDLQSPELNAFDERARRIIAAFAQQAELALENARLVENLGQAYHRLQADQEQLLAAEKMASLGRLTAGIAHEMNSPLAAVRSGLTEINHLVEEYQSAIGDAEITLDDHRAIACDMQKAVQLANLAAERASAFVRSVKSQTRDVSSAEQLPFRVAPVIKDALLLLDHAVRYAHCTVDFDYESEDLSLVGSPGRLAQVVTNLVTNAIDACSVKGGGTITIQLRRTPAHLDLQVSDTGIGIPPALMKKVFEPMFTTKPFGQGTGLGLTIIHDIVSGEFGGAIEMASQPNQGTTFLIHFPIEQGT